MSFAASAEDRQNIPVVTRFVSEIGGYEQKLLTQSQAGDVQTLEALLAIPFEAVSSDGSSVQRADWIAKAKINTASQKIVLNTLSVHESGDAAVASFRLRTESNQQEKFVVDVWVPEEEHWILQVRFISPVK